MKHNIIIFLLIFMYGIATISAQELNRDSVPPANTIVDQVDELPMYPGGYQALAAFFRKNFIYPAEAWQQSDKYEDVLRFVIRADGVACGLQKVHMHPALYEEVKRLFNIMPLWEPALKNGRPVNVDYTLPPTAAPLYDDRNTGLPFHVLKAMNKIQKITDENKDFKKGLDVEQINELKGLSSSIIAYTTRVDIFSPLARLLAAQGEYQEAVAVADSCTSQYKLRSIAKKEDYSGYPKDFAYIFKRFDEEGLIRPTGYDGRDNIHAALTYALVCSVSGNESLASQTYEQALEVITGRIEKLDIWMPQEEHNNYMYKQLMNEKIRLALTSPGNTMGRSDMKDLMETYTYGGAMKVIDQKVKEGKINNARIQQIDTQMEDMEKRRDPYARLNNKDMLNLYGLYALTLYLSEGMDAQQQYMDSLSLQSKKLKSYFKKMSKKMEKHRTELSDREAVIRSLACLAPINQKDETPSERKQKAKEFFRYRDAVKDVYPLEWLWK